MLTPISSAESAFVDAMYAVQSDPATWTHLPEAVETDIGQSRAIAEDHARSWRDLGLGWWLIRLREPLGALAAGSVVGLGGAAVRRPEVPAWNLGYRLTPRAWGQGFAGEVSRAAIRAAHIARPDLPVTARALTRNPASWRTLERAGLALVWEGAAPADDALTSGVERRIYADRTVPGSLLETLIALG
ncbi:GNAT family N-acetyltransferase [Microbacterium paraoxydans]|uniref:GNAT family N-acetyltransferase n=1 Tax=Microbacterium paraoxydans TaxID=199592 RepID=UPI001CF933FA|nr:GNAT family N-acetyltransferase [Microbacterium paraoxydans]